MGGWACDLKNVFTPYGNTRQTLAQRGQTESTTQQRDPAAAVVIYAKQMRFLPALNYVAGT